MTPLGGFRDLKVYQLSYTLAMEIFRETKRFPREELYSLTDQIRRASRAVPALIAEAWKKRRYVRAFVSKLSDSYTESGETEVWLDSHLTVITYRKIGMIIIDSDTMRSIECCSQ